MERGVAVPMRDGVNLRATIYRPAPEGRYPVLLQRNPYNRDFLPIATAVLDPLRAAANGYVVVVQDVRGRWESEGGPFYAYRDEFQDGCDSVAWAAQLPFANGRVGMYGLSYMGMAQWQAAVAQAPALQAIAPVTAPNDAFELDYRGGAFQLGLLTYWSMLPIGPNAVQRSQSENRLAEFLGLIEDIDANARWYRHRPLRSFPPLQRAGGFAPFFFDPLDHPTRDAYYEQFTVHHRHAAVRVPALIIAGWYDLLLGNDLRHFQSLRREGASVEAREGTRLIVGPWSHGMFASTVGDLDFGVRASGLLLDLREDLTGLHLRWFDYWLRDHGTGLRDDPPVRVLVMGENRWRGFRAWPPPEARPLRYHCRANGHLTREAPDDESPDRYDYNPEDPVTTLGGNLLVFPIYRAGPVEQGRILSRPDVLSFTTRPLDADLDVIGPVTVELWVSSTARDTDFMVKLCEVLPDGRTYNVADGVLRASYREGDRERVLLEPGQPVCLRIDCYATAKRFARGNAIRLLVTSSDFPRYSANPNSGELAQDATRSVVARQTIFHERARPSAIVLSVVA